MAVIRNNTDSSVLFRQFWTFHTHILQFARMSFVGYSQLRNKHEKKVCVQLPIRQMKT